MYLKYMFLAFQCGADGYHKLGGSYYLPNNYSHTVAPIDHDHSDPIEVTLKIDQLEINYYPNDGVDEYA